MTGKHPLRENKETLTPAVVTAAGEEARETPVDRPPIPFILSQQVVQQVLAIKTKLGLGAAPPARGYV